MRILLQNGIFHPNVIGGAERSSWLLARKLSERGHHVDALATTGRVAGAPRKIVERSLPGLSGVVHEAPVAGLYDLIEDEDARRPSLLARGIHHFQQIHSPRWLMLAGRVIDACRPDVLHTNTITGMTPAVWQAARRRGVPVVHTLRDYHLLCPRTTLLHGDGRECDDPRLPCRILAAAKLPRTALVDVVTSPTRFVLERHRRAGGFPDARAEVVFNAVETYPDDLPDRRGRRTVTGLYLGQLDDHKGVSLLMDTLRDLFTDPAAARLRFAFAGAGPRAAVVARFCEASAGRAASHGFVQGDDKDALLRAADFLVVPSIWNDNFPRVILDAFSYGLPVIGSSRGGIPEIVHPGIDGRIVEPETDALAAAMRGYLDDDATRLAHGAAGLVECRRYAVDKQIDLFEEIYRSLG